MRQNSGFLTQKLVTKAEHFLHWIHQLFTIFMCLVFEDIKLSELFTIAHLFLDSFPMEPLLVWRRHSKNCFLITLLRMPEHSTPALRAPLSTALRGWPHLRLFSVLLFCGCGNQAAKRMDVFYRLCQNQSF